MNDILHLLWQINYKRGPKDSLSLVIRYVSPTHNIAGEILWKDKEWGDQELRFGSTGECIYLLNTRFEKGILV